MRDKDNLMPSNVRLTVAVSDTGASTMYATGQTHEDGRVRVTPPSSTSDSIGHNGGGLSSSTPSIETVIDESELPSPAQAARTV